MGGRGAHLTLIKQRILSVFNVVTRVRVITEWLELYITLAIRVLLAHKRKLILGAQRLKAFLVFNIVD